MAHLRIDLAIRTARRSRKLTRRTVAERCGLAEKYICEVERGRQVPKLENLVKISNAIGVEPWRIVRFAGRAFAEQGGR